MPENKKKEYYCDLSIIKTVSKNDYSPFIVYTIILSLSEHSLPQPFADLSYFAALSWIFILEAAEKTKFKSVKLLNYLFCIIVSTAFNSLVSFINATVQQMLYRKSNYQNVELHSTFDINFFIVSYVNFLFCFNRVTSNISYLCNYKKTFHVQF